MSISLLVAISLYIVSYPLWTRPIISIGFESLAAVLSSLCIASTFTIMKRTRKRAFVYLASAFGYYALIEMGGAMEKQFLSISPILQKTPHILASDILEIFIFGCFMLLAAILQFRGDEKSPDKAFYLRVFILFCLAMTSQGLVRLGIFQHLDVDGVRLLALGFASASFAIYGAICVLLIRGHRLFEFTGTLRTVGAIVLLELSVFYSWLAVAEGSDIWIFSNCLQIVAYFTFYVGFTIPYLRAFNREDSKNGEIFGYSVAAVVIILLFVTMMVELAWPYIIHVDLGVASLADLGSTAMLLTITFFTFRFAKATKKRFLYPLLFIYGLWIAKGVTHIVLSLVYMHPHVETLVPTISANLLSIPAFGLTTLWMREDDAGETRLSPRNWIILGLILGCSLIMLGEVIRFVLYAEGLTHLPAIGRSLLLGLCMIAIMEHALISFTRFEINRGQLSLDSLSVAFLSLWFIPSLLKGTFTTWTIGWWLSEAALLIGVFIAPAIMGSMYLETTFRAQQSETRARVYADLLAHDITNHHQIIMSAIELSLLESTPAFAKKQTLTNALRTLQDADRLVRNVRKLGSLEVLSKSDLKPCDILTAISESVDLITNLYPNQSITLTTNQTPEECVILANNLLPDIFQNLLLNAVDHSDGTDIELEVQDIVQSDTHFWEIRIIDYGPGISPVKRESLFVRYMKGAKGSGLGLSLVGALTQFFDGSIRIEDRVPGDYRQGSCFILTFPALES